MSTILLVPTHPEKGLQILNLKIHAYCTYLPPPIPTQKCSCVHSLGVVLNW